MHKYLLTTAAVVLIIITLLVTGHGKDPYAGTWRDARADMNIELVRDEQGYKVTIDQRTLFDKARRQRTELRARIVKHAKYLLLEVAPGLTVDITPFPAVAGVPAHLLLQGREFYKQETTTPPASAETTK
jgi:hypothetical protein